MAEMSEAEKIRCIRAFESEEPLHLSFPLTLSNNAQVRAVTAICSCCKNPIDRDMVHGRLMHSLPTVITMEGNAYCARCQQMTHLYCRFRTIDQTYQVEWPDRDGDWYSQVAANPSIYARVLAWLCGLPAR